MLDDDQGTPLAAGTPLWRPINGSECIIIPRYTTTDIEAVRKFIVTISPNPTSDYITVTFNEIINEEVTIQIYDARGKICQSFENIKDQNFKVDVSNLCSGVNYINILTKNDVESHKLIIVK